MKVVTYKGPQGQGLPGVVDGDRVFDLTALGYRDLSAFIAAGEPAIAAAKGLVANGHAASTLADAELVAPLAAPPRIFCVGLNYHDHARESNFEVPPVPTIFLKLASSIVGPGADVVLPSLSKQPDYEAELAVVIGKGGEHITAETWEQHVFGYTILNDISARDVQLATTQWTLGKSFAGFCPVGPWIVTKDEVPDPHALDIRLSIDGEVMQDANTRDLIFAVPDILAYISSIAPLEAGDIVSTGTPPGVGLGRTPQRWLRPEEEMVITISGIGELRNTTRAGS